MFREPVSVVVIAMLLVVGTESLRRQVRRESPSDRSTPSFNARGKLGEVRRRVSEGVPHPAIRTRLRLPQRPGELRSPNGGGDLVRIVPQVRQCGQHPSVLGPAGL